MTPTMRVRELTGDERQALRRGFESADGFTARRCQVLLASAAGAGPAAIGATVGLSTQAVRNAIRAFHASGLGCLARKPPVAKTPATVWDRTHDDELKDLLHRRPREFGKATSLWTLALAAEVPREGVDVPPADGRGDAGRTRPARNRVEAGQAPDHQPGPRLRQERKLRDRLIAQAAKHPDWGVGFQDACWWTRLAQPDLFAWAGGGPLRLSGNARDPKGGREAVACYGVLRHGTGGMVPRFCEGRPVSATTADFMGWVCRGLAAEGKKVFVLAWDNAAWHVSKRVRAWVAAHNRRAYRTKQGCRIRVCGLPVKAPWLNPIEPKWVHGKRAIVEPDRKLSAGEVQQRACDYYGCKPHPLLAKPAT